MENELYKIRYTPLAYEDLDSIDSYISETLCNESAAERLLDKSKKRPASSNSSRAWAAR